MAMNVYFWGTARAAANQFLLQEGFNLYQVCPGFVLFEVQHLYDPSRVRLIGRLLVYLSLFPKREESYTSMLLSVLSIIAIFYIVIIIIIILIIIIHNTQGDPYSLSDMFM